MRNAVNGLKAIKVNFVGLTPISLLVISESPMFDEKGALLVTKKECAEEYFFEEVSEGRLMQLRLAREPGVVYKYNGKLYYTKVPADLQLTKSEKTHLCGKGCNNVCKNCTRTRDLTVSFQEKDDKDFPSAVYDAWRVEKYPYITEALEAFNMEHPNDALMVYECTDYIPSDFKAHKVQKCSSSVLKVTLAHFCWPDFKEEYGYEEMKARINANLALAAKSNEINHNKLQLAR